MSRESSLNESSCSDNNGEPTPNALVRNVRQALKNVWRRDEQLIPRLFPINPLLHDRFQEVKKLYYNDFKDPSKVGKRRWKRIPKSPGSVSKLYTPLTNLLNNILHVYGIGRRDRLFLNTHSKPVIGDPYVKLSPGIFLAGVGPEFGTNRLELPQAFYLSGISALEVLLDTEDAIEARDRVAFHIHHIFQHQENRRFAFGLVITQNFVTVHMFDHSGAVTSRPLNYHQHPEQFFAIVSGLANGTTQLGFDDSLVLDGDLGRLCTVETKSNGMKVEKFYWLDTLIFKFPFLIGRGTVCWVASETRDFKSTFVIKDAWVSPCELEGRESEGSLLQHAQARGVTTGVVNLRHFEEVRCGDTPQLDTVLSNRRMKDIPRELQKLDLVHTRIVMEPYGKTLDKFSNRKEFILAFHDSVIAHRNLHDVAGILHRDISIHNILINPDGEEGNRGILIDFDHAIRVDDASPYSKQTQIGTWRYMSRNVQGGRGPHTYLDDLESFYYVLCWILVTFEGPGRFKNNGRSEASTWDHPGGQSMKYGHFLSGFTLEVQPWFGNMFRDMAIRLFKFFGERFKKIGQPLSALDPKKDYEEFISHIKRCISDMEAEPTTDLPTAIASHDCAPAPDEPQLPVVSTGSRIHTSNQEATQKSRRNRNAGKIPPIGVARGRRQTANYGEPVPLTKILS